MFSEEEKFWGELVDLILLLNTFQVYRCIAAGMVHLSNFCEELIKYSFSLCKIVERLYSFDPVTMSVIIFELQNISRV
jgi:hypothetical protein